MCKITLKLNLCIIIAEKSFKNWSSYCPHLEKRNGNTFSLHSFFPWGNNNNKCLFFNRPHGVFFNTGLCQTVAHQILVIQRKNLNYIMYGYNASNMLVYQHITSTSFICMCLL